MQHRAETRYPEIHFEMTMTVPAQRSDAIAALHSHPLQRPGEPMDARVEISVGVAMRSAVLGSRDDLLAREQTRRALQHGSQRQRCVHHQTLHSLSPCRTATYPQPITARNIA